MSRDCNKKALKLVAEMKHKLSDCILIPTLVLVYTWQKLGLKCMH